MAVLPMNEKLLLVEGDDEAWVDTHHGLGESQSGYIPDFHHPRHTHSALEQTVDKLVEMTLDSAPEATPTAPTQLVGMPTEEDSDSDSEPVVDIDEYTEDVKDPVFPLSCTCHVTVTWSLLHRLLHQSRRRPHPPTLRRWGFCVLVRMT